MSNHLRNMLSQSAFWIVNKAVTSYLGNLDAALLLSDLYGRRERLRDQLDSKGGFFALSEEIERDLFMGKKARLTATKRLIDAGFVTVELKHIGTAQDGYKSVNFYYIDDDKVIREIGNGGRSKTNQGAVQNDTATEKLSSSGDSSDQPTQAGSQPSFASDAQNRFTGPTPPHPRATPEKPASVAARPDWKDIVNTWQAENPEHAVNALGKTEVYADLFSQFRAHGYSHQETKSFQKQLEHILAPKRTNKQWCSDVEKAIHRGRAAAFPTKATAVQTYEQRRAAGTVEAHEVPHAAKRFEKKVVNIVDVGEVFDEER